MRLDTALTITRANQSCNPFLEVERLMFPPLLHHPAFPPVPSRPVTGVSRKKKNTHTNISHVLATAEDVKATGGRFEPYLPCETMLIALCTVSLATRWFDTSVVVARSSAPVRFTGGACKGGKFENRWRYGTLPPGSSRGVLASRPGRFDRSIPPVVSRCTSRGKPAPIRCPLFQPGPDRTPWIGLPAA